MRTLVLISSILCSIGFASAQGPSAGEPKSVKVKIAASEVAELPPCVRSGFYSGSDINDDGTITVNCIEGQHCCIRARKEKSNNRTIMDAYDENGNVVATFSCSSSTEDEDGNVVLQQASIVR